MNASYTALLGLVAPVFLVLASGYGLRRLGKLQPAADASLLSVAVNFLYPCFIADTVLGNAALRDVGTVLLAPIAGCALLLGSFAFAALCARLGRLNHPQPGRTFAFTAAIPNWGYLPIPLIQGLYGEETTGVLFAHNIGFEIAMWSVGVWLLAGHGSWRRAINVPFLAILAALLLNLLRAGEWMPLFLIRTLHLLGQGAIPLSLLLTGATLADAVSAGGLTHDVRRTIGGCLVKLALLPPLILTIAHALPLSLELKRVLAVQAAMPSALVPVILARHYHADAGTAVRIVIASTVLGLLTIPLWLRIGAWWLGLA